MKIQDRGAVRVLLAMLATWVSMALAGTAFAAKITEAQQAKVKIGMTEQDVVQLLGPPVEVNRVRYAPGKTLVYEIGDEGSVRHFELDFDVDGKVVWISRHELSGR